MECRPRLLVEGLKLAYVVESPVTNPKGIRTGTARVYVATQARAEQLASEVPGRTYRPIRFEDMPEAARQNMTGESA